MLEHLGTHCRHLLLSSRRYRRANPPRQIVQLGELTKHYGLATMLGIFQHSLAMPTCQSPTSFQWENYDDLLLDVCINTGQNWESITMNHGQVQLSVLHRQSIYRSFHIITTSGSSKCLDTYFPFPIPLDPHGSKWTLSHHTAGGKAKLSRCVSSSNTTLNNAFMLLLTRPRNTLSGVKDHGHAHDINKENDERRPLAFDWCRTGFISGRSSMLRVARGFRTNEFYAFLHAQINNVDSCACHYRARPIRYSRD